MKKFRLFITIFFILFFLPFISNISFAKYIFDDISVVANINIDILEPDIQFINSTNTNKGYEKYANKTHTLSFTFKITEKNLMINNINTRTVKFKIDNQLVYPKILDLQLISDNQIDKTYRITITNVEGNGKLNIYFPKGILIDTSTQVNSAKTFDTGIIIDNIAPEFTFSENLIQDKKSNAIINSNENLRPLSGWNLNNSSNSLNKVFTSPIYYPLNITDYAENSSEVFVSIEKATNILIKYCNYNSYPDTSFQTGGKISGKQAIIDNSLKKTEALMVTTEGNIDKSFLKSRVFDYNYWGEGSKINCSFSEIPFYYGYNPGNSLWCDMNSNKQLIYFFGTLCLELGGIGQNQAGNVAQNVIKPIPENIAKQYLFGLSSVNFSLTSYDDYSIVYQIYVSKVGWLTPKSDGNESKYSYDKPFSAFRMVLAPKSEKQRLISYWNRDIGTNNVN